MKNILGSLLCVALFVNTCCAQQFRVVGYMRNQAGLAESVKSVDLDKITHLNIAFTNPDSLGNLVVAPGLKQVVATAHRKNVKVLLSIGGGLPPRWLPRFIYGDKQDDFIKNLAAITAAYKVDGIDVDLEGGLIDSNYEAFVVKLAAALKHKHKLVTSAIATVYADRYTDKALAQYDFINVMCYDKTGPWRPEKPGPHAPYDMAEEDMTYWTTDRKLSKEKLSLGLPFYGYGFGGSAPESISYRELIAKYPDAVDKDEVPAGGGTIYFNGAATIKRKVKLAKEKAGGVMIWQLLQDAKGKESLLEVIDKEIARRNQ